MLTKDGVIEALETYTGDHLLVSKRHPAWIACHAFLARLPPPLLQGGRFSFLEREEMGDRLDWYMSKESQRGEVVEHQMARESDARIYIPVVGGKKIEMQEKYAALLDGYRLEVLQFERAFGPAEGHPIGAFNDRGNLVLAVMPLRK